MITHRYIPSGNPQAVAASAGCWFSLILMQSGEALGRWGRDEQEIVEPLRPYLVGGLEHILFLHILGIIIPIDVNIFQRGWKPPARYNMYFNGYVIYVSLII